MVELFKFDLNIISQGNNDTYEIMHRSFRVAKWLALLTLGHEASDLNPVGGGMQLITFFFFFFFVHIAFLCHPSIISI